MASKRDEIEETREALGDLDDLASQYSWAVAYWMPRNEFIQKARDVDEGKNDIEVPKSMQYKARPLHTYLMATLNNERISRYLNFPEVQVILEDPLDEKEIARSTNIERGLTASAYEMERFGDGKVWSRSLYDAILLDGGCELIEFIPNTIWKGLDEAKDKEEYKKKMGPPFRSLYVPLESTFPVYDGPIPELNFHIEFKSLWACRHNPLFDQTSLAKWDSLSEVRGLDMEVPIVRISNQTHYGYYAMYADFPRRDVGTQRGATEMPTEGEFKYLYGYEHGLGRLPYNFFSGKYGGWKGERNRIESTIRALIENNEAADEVVSQVLTNIRAKYWGSMKYFVNPELRGYANEDPKPPDIVEGEPIPMYVGEDMVPLYQPENDSAAPWILDQIKETIGNLGGSPAIFGRREAGVDVGYLHASQVSQAEHLDEMQEQSAIQAGINRFTIMMLYIKEYDERVWAYYTTSKSGNRKKGNWAYLDPKEMDPLPRLDVRVRRPRPVDFISAIRAAREASDDRGGKGPLYSDHTIYERIMGDEFPNIEDSKIRLQEVKRDLSKGGILTNRVAEMMNMKLARTGVPEISPEMLGSVDPALLSALQDMIASGEAAPGGISPDIIAKLTGRQAGPRAVQNPLNRSGGVLPGDSEPEARIGEEIARNVR